MLLHAYGMGGTIRTVISQANHMADAGHEVEIVSVVRRRKNPQFAIDPRVRVITLADQRAGVSPDSTVRRVWRRVRGKIVPRGEFAAGYFTERVEKAVIDYVTGLDGGVLVTTRPALNLISARRAPDHVVRVGQEHMNLATYKKGVREAIGRYYGGLDAVAVLTETDRADFRRAVPGLRVERIPNAVHRIDRARSALTAPVMVAAGRLFTQKGFDLLIPAFAEVVKAHPDWRLRIFGSGPKKDMLQAMIDERGLGGAVTLMGRTEHLDRELAAASAYVLSSRFEGLPMVMIEAMAHGLPIVAFDCPTGPRDVLTHGEDGLLVPPGDIAALAAGMRRVVEEPELRRRLGGAAARTVRAYAPAVVMPTWEALFTELTLGRRRSADRPGR
ncbi:hypothetical protein Sru01_01830 [Sphaerisporangium rufum]|uniref:Glycosyl transferase family 1 domain-containing protein n=2 Tax=Sphaerisporangium rufum TaxID=1381558 RepID=A0A919QW26_9ACTN|nr:hypothetical protein Sru01_01830 [Sphaerisporangium rufum]